MSYGGYSTGGAGGYPAAGAAGGYSTGAAGGYSTAGYSTTGYSTASAAGGQTGWGAYATPGAGATPGAAAYSGMGGGMAARGGAGGAGAQSRLMAMAMGGGGGMGSGGGFSGSRAPKPGAGSTFDQKKYSAYGTKRPGSDRGGRGGGSGEKRPRRDREETNKPREGREEAPPLFVDAKFNVWNLPCKAKVLLVSNIPSDICFPESLYNLFSFYGDVARIKMLRKKQNTALIEFDTATFACLARDHLDGTEVRCFIMLSTLFIAIAIATFNIVIHMLLCSLFVFVLLLFLLLFFTFGTSDGTINKTSSWQKRPAQK